MKIVNKESVIYKRRIIQIYEGSKYGEFIAEKLGTYFDINKLNEIPKEELYEKLPQTVKKNLSPYTNYPFMEIDYSFKNFKFPPQHPIEGLIYCCSDYNDEYYMPINEFHNYSLKLKESAFIEMCAHLGAKEIILMEEEINGEKTELNLELNVWVIKAKAEYNESKSTESKSAFSYRFPKPEEFNINKYDSKWVESEPTWNTLQNLRINNDLESYVAEFSYSDEMGITASLAAKLFKFGLEIGGSFNEIKKTQRKYHITFWNRN